MSANRRLFDDVSKLATSAAGLVQGAGREAEMLLGHRLERILDRMDLVTREEFDVVKEMATQARMENELLAKRLTVLEEVIQRNNAKKMARTTPVGRGKARAKLAARTKKTQKTSK
ncbi:MAG: accessory factor UbiK family protein [Alphaproteobacteria bacterium]